MIWCVRIFFEPLRKNFKSDGFQIQGNSSLVTQLPLSAEKYLIKQIKYKQKKRRQYKVESPRFSFSFSKWNFELHFADW